MFAIASKPKRFSLGDDFIDGSSSAGRIIYLDSSNSHGLIVGPLWYGVQNSWDSWVSKDGGTENGYGLYRTPTYSEFQTYIQPMLNETQTDYLPWGVYSGWPASEQGLDKWWTGTEQSPTAAYAYSVQTDTFVALSKNVSTAIGGFLVREF